MKIKTFYSKFTADSDKNIEGHRTGYSVLFYLILVLMGIGIGTVSLMLGSRFLRGDGVDMFSSYFQSLPILLLNMLPPVLLILLFYFVSGRVWIAFSASAFIVFALSLVNFYKIQLRSDPFMAADLTYVSEANNILSNYDIIISGRVIVTVLVFVLGILFSVFVMKRKLKRPVMRAVGAVSVAAACVILYTAVYTSDTVYKNTETTADINIWSDLQVYVSKGFMYPFIHSVKNAFPSPPEGYDKALAAETLSANDYGDMETKVNVISIMLEAYSDISVFDGIELQPMFEMTVSEDGTAVTSTEIAVSDVYAPLNVLRHKCVYGSIVDNIFAGGTTNTERCFLTGYTEVEDWRGDINSYVRYFGEQGYYTEGFHAGNEWFYNRANVNKYLGFDEYYFLEDFEDGDRTDEYFFKKVREMYDSRDKSVPYFSYSLSYQNHGGYDSEQTGDVSYIAQGDLSDESYNILNNYLTGIYDTNVRLQSFIESFEDDPAPVVIVVFGDHKPWLGNGNSVYGELNVNLDLSTEEGFYNYYTTPYLIYANRVARMKLNNDFTGYGGDFSSCFLMNKLFELCSWEGNEYMQETNRLMEYTDIVNIPTGYFRENGVLTQEMSAEAKDFYTLFKSVEYYWRHNLASETGLRNN